MADTTCLNCLRIIENGQGYPRKFCNMNCYTSFTDMNNKIKKANMLIERERNYWKKNQLDNYRKFYEIFFIDKTCDICGESFSNNLHLKVKPDINLQDINEDSFQILCSDCYLKISGMKNNKET